ncbi:unnamed protein product, partial [marine sediment metagenome]
SPLSDGAGDLHMWGDLGRTPSAAALLIGHPMLLVQALLRQDKVRRESWPEGVYASASIHHRIGMYPLSLSDIDDTSDEPRGVCCRLDLLAADPEGRQFSFRDLGAGMSCPESPVHRFHIPNWKPSVDDLFASDWITL